MNKILLKIRNKLLKDKKGTLECFLLVCIIGAIVLPIMICAFYALPAADDFSHANETRIALQNNNIFAAACIKTRETYLTWQGTFTSTFLVNIFEPLGTVGITGLRILLCLNILFLAVSVICFGIVIGEKWYSLYDRKTLLILLTVFIFVSFGTCRGGQEIFYWYTGACVYTLPLSLTFCCLTIYINYLWGKKSVETMIGLSVLAFLTSGGVLQITAILCFGMLGLWGGYLYTHRNKEGVLSGIPFLASFIGALINAFAPGNFVRHDAWEEGIHIFKAIKNVLIIAMSQIKDIFKTENLFLYVIIFCFLIAAYRATESKATDRKYHPIIMIIILLAGFLISLFPYCLGVGSAGMALRNIYMCDLYIGWSSVVWALEFGSWFGINGGYRIRKEGLLLTFICVMLIFFRSGDMGKVFQGTSARTLYGLCSGEIQRCSAEWSSLLEDIDNAEESDVLIETKRIPETILMSPGISEDKTNFVNKFIAEYYGKDTVTVIFTGEERAGEN